MGALLASAPVVASADATPPDATPPAAAAAKAPSGAFAGPWQVRQVLIDERRADRLLYQVDDPRLVGRTVAIGAEQVDADLPEATHCQQPQLSTERLALDTLLARTLVPELPAQGAAQQFDAKLPGERSLDLVWIRCKAGSFGPALATSPAAVSGSAAGGNAPGGIWLAVLPRGEALMPWYGRTLLVLQRQSAAGVSRPSFACSKARLLAEKAICASPSLASYDRSLAKAWTYTVEFCDEDEDCLSDARQAQQRWLVQRNRCNADRACLHKTLRERLQALMTPPAD